MRELKPEHGWKFELGKRSGSPGTVVVLKNPYAPSTALYGLTDECKAWLDDNCKGQYDSFPGNTFVRVCFDNERDATLFWTFYG